MFKNNLIYKGIILLTLLVCLFTPKAEVNSLELRNINLSEMFEKDTIYVTSNKEITRKMRRAINQKKLVVLDTTYRTKTLSSAKGTDKVKLLVDSLRNEGVAVDSTTIDSLARMLFSDTLIVKGGIMPKVNADGSLTNARILDSLLFAERLAQGKAAAKKEKVNIFRDTIAFGKMSTLAVVFPGYGQMYNKQQWKLPILYTSVGSLAAAGVVYNSKAKDTKSLFDKAVAESNQTEIDNLYSKYRNQQTTSTLFYVGSGLTYMYFLADAAFNYKGVTDTKDRATYLAFMFPGAGQIYNGQYWKLPIVYGGFATMAYIINYNSRGYIRYKTAYDAVSQGLDDEFNGAVTETVLENVKNSFRRARDMAIYYTIGFYLVTVVDAYVSASFKQYDISDDLSLKVVPSVDYGNLGRNNINNGSVGMSMRLTF